VIEMVLKFKRKREYKHINCPSCKHKLDFIVDVKTNTIIDCVAWIDSVYKDSQLYYICLNCQSELWWK